MHDGLPDRRMDRGRIPSGRKVLRFVRINLVELQYGTVHLVASKEYKSNMNYNTILSQGPFENFLYQI